MLKKSECKDCISAFALNKVKTQNSFMRSTMMNTCMERAPNKPMQRATRELVMAFYKLLSLHKLVDVSKGLHNLINSTNSRIFTHASLVMDYLSEACELTNITTSATNFSARFGTREPVIR